MPYLDRMPTAMGLALAAVLSLIGGAAHADDEPPPGIDLIRSSFQHTLRVLPTAPRMFIDVNVNSAATTPGMLGRGLCLSLFMQYPGGSGGEVLNLESNLSVDGSVLTLRSCQGRTDARGFSVDLSDRQVFWAEKGFEGFRQSPSLAPRAGVAAGKAIGVLTTPLAISDEGTPVVVRAAAEGVQLDEAVYDARGQLSRLVHQASLWDTKLAPEVYAALGDLQQKTSSELREVRLERDERGRLQRLWLHRAWHRFDAEGQAMKGDDASALLRAPRELLAQFEWPVTGNAPVAITNGNGASIMLRRSADGRRLAIGASGKPVADLEFDSKGALTRLRQGEAEHTLFHDSVTGQLLAYLSPTGCTNAFQTAGTTASDSYKLQLRVHCPNGTPALWEALVRREPRSRVLKARVQVIDAKGSREVYHRPWE